MSKSSTPRLLPEHEAQAIARGLKGSVQKAQLVLDLIRGKPVAQAINELSFCNKRLAPLAKKVLLSAIANAEHNHQLNVDRLIVARAFAEKGAVLKRFNPRARGRAAPIHKHNCGLTIVVAEQAPVAAKPAAKANQPAAAKAAKTTETQPNATTEA
jgi:large subunit ribosomal protein L22